MKAVFTCLIILAAAGCKKKDDGDNSPNKCRGNAKVISVVTEKNATVYMDATIIGLYLVEDGSIDQKLVPCELLPMELMQDRMKVVVSGELLEDKPQEGGPCCVNYFRVTKIRKL